MECRSIYSTLLNSIVFGCRGLVCSLSNIIRMSQVKSVPRAKRSKIVHDYANLSKRGLQSLNPARVRARVKAVKKKDKSASPSSSSGDWRVELLDKHDKKQDGGRPAIIEQVGECVQHDRAKPAFGTGDNTSFVTPVNERSRHNPVHEGQGKFNDMCTVFQDKMSLEE